MDIILNNPVISFFLLISFLVFFILTKRVFKYLFILIIGSILIFAFTGCSSGNLNMNNNMENIEENTLTRIQDLPFVKNSKIDIEKSLILGEGKSWSGQLFIRIPEPKPDVFNFYIKNLDEFGWKEQTTIRGETSVMNYVGENNRVAIITIVDGAFNSSEVLISVSPYTEEFEDKVSDFINEKYLELKD